MWWLSCVYETTRAGATHQSRPIFKQVPDTLVLRDGTINWIFVLKFVGINNLWYIGADSLDNAAKFKRQCFKAWFIMIQKRVTSTTWKRQKAYSLTSEREDCSFTRYAIRSFAAAESTFFTRQGKVVNWKSNTRRCYNNAKRELATISTS